MLIIRGRDEAGAVQLERMPLEEEGGAEERVDVLTRNLQRREEEARKELEKFAEALVSGKGFEPKLPEGPKGVEYPVKKFTTQLQERVQAYKNAVQRSRETARQYLEVKRLLPEAEAEEAKTRQAFEEATRRLTELQTQSEVLPSSLWGDKKNLERLENEIVKLPIEFQYRYAD